MKNRISRLSVIIVLFISFTALNSPILTGKTNTGTQCSNPTTEVEIRVLAGIRYNINEIIVPKATCVKITLVNEDPDIGHDFTIDGTTGDSGIEQVYISAAGGTTGSVNVTTPDADVTFDFYCSIQGHRAAGMDGSFIVGEGISLTTETSSSGKNSVSQSNEESDSITIEESDSLTINGYGFVISLLSIFSLSITLRRKSSKQN
ncbi:MAG: plastocyanin/azurin family copper-binding protein [Candidatus Heimdallarchaeota archaeon]